MTLLDPVRSDLGIVLNIHIPEMKNGIKLMEAWGGGTIISEDDVRDIECKCAQIKTACECIMRWCDRYYHDIGIVEADFSTKKD